MQLEGQLLQLQQVDARWEQEVVEAKTAIATQTQEHLHLTEQLTERATTATVRLQLLEVEVMRYRQPSNSTRMLDEAVLLDLSEAFIAKMQDIFTEHQRKLRVELERACRPLNQLWPR